MSFNTFALYLGGLVVIWAFYNEEANIPKTLLGRFAFWTFWFVVGLGFSYPILFVLNLVAALVMR